MSNTTNTTTKSVFNTTMSNVINVIKDQLTTLWETSGNTSPTTVVHEAAQYGHPLLKVKANVTDFGIEEGVCYMACRLDDELLRVQLERGVVTVATSKFNSIEVL